VNVPDHFLSMARSGANPIAPRDIIEALRAKASPSVRSSRLSVDDFPNPI